MSLAPFLMLISIVFPAAGSLLALANAARVRQATVWISADEKRRPLRVVSQVFIGSVNIEMAHEGVGSPGPKIPDSL